VSSIHLFTVFAALGSVFSHHSSFCHAYVLASTDSALTTFSRETDEGYELNLHGAEVAALMNLVATDTLVEEAVALIPSLSRFPEAAMDEILDLIRSTMIRIVS